MEISIRNLHGRLVFVLFLMTIGCSSESPRPKLPDSVKVTGRITLDGKPLDNVAIRFAPTTAEGFHGATGMSDKVGIYEMTTDIGNGQSRPGAIPGKYTVYVSRLAGADGVAIPFDPKVPPMMQGGRESIPMKYAGGILKYEVPASGGTFDIDLFSK